MIEFCKKCIMPDTRPDQIFNESGICNACLSFERNEEIDWNERKKEFEKIEEVPYVFDTRIHGKTKRKLKTYIDFLITLIKLRLVLRK